MSMAPCRNLDYTEGKFTHCEIIEITDQFLLAACRIRYWKRGEQWLAGPGGTRNPQNVQFCGAGRGRINGIFQCYNPGEMSCYEAEETP